MREIKFRAWDSHNKEMWHGDLFSPIWTDGTVQDCYSEYMQYTGLKDKSGKGLYESDLIVCQSYPFYSEGFHNYVAEIVWYDDAAMFGYEYHAISSRVRGNVVGGSLDELIGMEIIGNIYENPELLEE
jgi:uncharacterized phage protein (TIGR01671 family)